jgi:hypothetical protein
MAGSVNTNDKDVLHSWRIKVPSAFGNPPLMKTLFFATLIPAPAFVFLVGVIFTGDVTGMLRAAGVGMMVGFGLFILSVLISLIVSHGDVGYVITPKGVRFFVGDFIKKLNRMAVIGGALGRSASTMGAGMLAASREDENFPFREARTVRIYRRARIILLMRRSWLGTMSIYLTPDNFEAVRETVLAHCPKARVKEK